MLHNKKNTMCRNLLFLLIASFVVSCKITSVSSTYLKNYKSLPGNKNFNKHWAEKLYLSKDSAKALWAKRMDNDWSFYRGKISNGDISNVEFIPIFVYKMDYTAYSSLNEKSEIIKVIQLDTSKCAFYLVKNNEILGDTYSSFRNGSVKTSLGGTNMDSQYASKILSFLRASNQCVFNIQVYNYPKTDYYFTNDVFYKDNEIIEVASNLPFKTFILDFKSRHERAIKLKMVN